MSEIKYKTENPVGLTPADVACRHRWDRVTGARPVSVLVSQWHLYLYTLSSCVLRTNIYTFTSSKTISFFLHFLQQYYIHFGPVVFNYMYPIVYRKPDEFARVKEGGDSIYIYITDVGLVHGCVHKLHKYLFFFFFIISR